MSAQEPLMTQLVELLGISHATGWPPSTEEVVIITVRPQPDSFRPHNIALKKAQAVRLLKDLESLLNVPVVVLVAFLPLASCGCSARVEVDRANDTDATATEATTAEISRTTVEVDFQPRSQQPVSQPQPPPVPVTVAPEPQPVIVTNNIVVIKGGDTHNETHIHVHDAPRRYFEETVVIRREVQAEYRPVDPRCEQLRREHEERVRTVEGVSVGRMIKRCGTWHDPNSDALAARQVSFLMSLTANTPGPRS